MPNESDTSRRIVPPARYEARADGDKPCLDLTGVLLEARQNQIRSLLIGWIPPLSPFTDRDCNF
jgi:hypothetical protein